ncbi:methyltransferase domain-containing protein [Candidatus Woesearchaeota archaeon]|nr:methyltransferase domain-containing protein [Candidatus Woesearchaeota archaeon]
MRNIFLLSKENIELAKQEALALAKGRDYELFENLLFIDTDIDLHKRLAFSHSVFRFLFRCKLSELIKQIKNYDWDSIYKENFCVRVHGGVDERKIADNIWKSLEKPRVNLNNPKTKIEFFILNGKAVCGIFLRDVDKSFLKRKAHLRPELLPTSLNPRLARACINLTGIMKGVLLDPFCGSGGILIEAALMGYKVIGYDISDYILKKCKTNLEFYKIRSFRLEKKDGTQLNQKSDAIVTDLPYGKGSKLSKEREKLYADFLKSSYKTTERMVVIFPNYADFSKVIKKSKWKLKKEFSVYIHRSLTRKVCVLRKS